MSVSRSRLMIALLAIGFVGIARFSLATDIIYSDNFDGTGGILTGRAPDTQSGLDGGSTGTTWAGDSTVSTNPDALWTASGGTYSTTGSTNASVGTFGTGADANLITNAYLPFVPQTGLVYDLHLAIASSGVGASTNWLGLAFAPATLPHPLGGASSALSNQNPFGLIIDKGSGQVQSFGGGGTANAGLNTATGFIAQGTTSAVYHTFDVLLDTTGTQWKVSWLVDGVFPSGVGPTSFTYTSNPSIGNVIFGSNKLTGVVSDFSLTAVPEPSTLILAGLGLVGLVGSVRRRK